MSTSRSIKFGMLGLLMAAIGLIAWANTWRTSLKVKRITIEGARIVGNQEIIKLAHIDRSMQLQDIDLTVVRKNILTHHFIKEAVVQRDLPATLIVSITERVPLAIINAGELLYLDEEGVVLPHSISKHIFDLPVLSGIPDNLAVAPGKTVKTDDLLEALHILATCKLVNKELYHMISEVHLRDGGDIVLYTADRGVPIIFGRGEVVDKLVRLESFWNSVVLTQGSENLEYVDLRYADQVVVRWRGKQG
ncbi:MAG: cell division protein FtsQ/DivIB [bacterium]